MLYFPQLSTGAMGQYPIQKRRRSRTVLNESLDGSRIKLADASAASVEWVLGFQTLTDSERDALAQFHGTVEGRLLDFTFLDPADNLLCWSEKLDETVWSRNLLLVVTLGIADPNGGTNATRIVNTGAGPLAIQQVVNGPGWFHYAFSLQARSAVPQQIKLIRSTVSASQFSTYQIGPAWTPLLLTGNIPGTDPAVTFGIQVPAGGSIDVFGIQVEAQIAASGYKKTFSNCGVYPQARFLDDALSLQADGPGQHSCQIGIHARL
jgi:hypothetical protein